MRGNYGKSDLIWYQPLLDIQGYGIEISVNRPFHAYLKGFNWASMYLRVKKNSILPAVSISNLYSEISLGRREYNWATTKDYPIQLLFPRENSMNASCIGSSDISHISGWKTYGSLKKDFFDEQGWLAQNN